MPSPLGHALAGIAVGWLIAPPDADAGRRSTAGVVALYGLAGTLPDVDLVFGAHSGPTHGLGAAIVAGAVTMLVVRRIRALAGAPGPWGRTPLAWFTIGLAVAAAYASHTLLDWLGTDTSPPIGIMALWPFSRGYYESSLHVFMAISRRYWLSEFWTYNLTALARELLILLPLLVVVVAGKPRRRSGGC